MARRFDDHFVHVEHSRTTTTSTVMLSVPTSTLHNLESLTSIGVTMGKENERVQVNRHTLDNEWGAASSSKCCPDSEDECRNEHGEMLIERFGTGSTAASCTLDTLLSLNSVETATDTEAEESSEKRRETSDKIDGPTTRLPEIDNRLKLKEPPGKHSANSFAATVLPQQSSNTSFFASPLSSICPNPDNSFRNSGFQCTPPRTPSLPTTFSNRPGAPFAVVPIKSCSSLSSGTSACDSTAAPVASLPTTATTTSRVPLRLSLWLPLRSRRNQAPHGDQRTASSPTASANGGQTRRASDSRKTPNSRISGIQFLDEQVVPHSAGVSPTHSLREGFGPNSDSVSDAQDLEEKMSSRVSFCTQPSKVFEYDAFPWEEDATHSSSGGRSPDGWSPSGFDRMYPPPQDVVARLSPRHVGRHGGSRSGGKSPFFRSPRRRPRRRSRLPPLPDEGAGIERAGYLDIAEAEHERLNEVEEGENDQDEADEPHAGESVENQLYNSSANDENSDNELKMSGEKYVFADPDVAVLPIPSKRGSYYVDASAGSPCGAKRREADAINLFNESSPPSSHFERLPGNAHTSLTAGTRGVDAYSLRPNSTCAPLPILTPRLPVASGTFAAIRSTKAANSAVTLSTTSASDEIEDGKQLAHSHHGVPMGRQNEKLSQTPIDFIGQEKEDVPDDVLHKTSDVRWLLTAKTKEDETSSEAMKKNMKAAPIDTDVGPADIIGLSEHLCAGQKTEKCTYSGNELDNGKVLSKTGVTSLSRVLLEVRERFESIPNLDSHSPCHSEENMSPGTARDGHSSGLSVCVGTNHRAYTPSLSGGGSSPTTEATVTRPPRGFSGGSSSSGVARTPRHSSNVCWRMNREEDSTSEQNWTLPSTPTRPSRGYAFGCSASANPSVTSPVSAPPSKESTEAAASPNFGGFFDYFYDQAQQIIRGDDASPPANTKANNSAYVQASGSPWPLRKGGRRTCTDQDAVKNSETCQETKTEGKATVPGCADRATARAERNLTGPDSEFTEDIERFLPLHEYRQYGSSETNAGPVDHSVASFPKYTRVRGSIPRRTQHKQQPTKTPRHKRNSHLTPFSAGASEQLNSFGQPAVCTAKLNAGLPLVVV
eukprot:GHVT01005416.1.p1 GENE.GHVT01005416.1~~GHVT01005416.1.p1  ORF type:complete len:1110 (+),score=137.14 GHVT01005416.1:1302-4631(+)